MKIIERYITRELFMPFIVVVLILAGLFASFSSARFLAGALTESLGIGALLKLVLLKTIIALEVLIPVALYIAVISALGRMNKDQELNVLRSVGVSGRHIVAIVLMFAIPVGIFSGLLSSYVRPWAYSESYILDARAEAELNTNRFQAGRFYGSDSSGRVVYVQSKDEINKQMNNIFHYINKPETSEIIIAKEALQVQPTTRDERPNIQLTDGYIYQLSHAASQDDIIKFEKMTYFTDSELALRYKRKALSTRTLLESEDPWEIAELQWRLTRPVATVLLALTAMVFVQVAPRQDKATKTYLLAAIVFTVYYNLNGLVKNWVEQHTIDTVPGLWWLYITLFILLLIYSLKRGEKLLSFR